MLLACAFLSPDHQGPGQAPSSRFDEWIAGTGSVGLVPDYPDDGSNGAPVYCYEPRGLPVSGAMGGCRIRLIAPVAGQEPWPSATAWEVTFAREAEAGLGLTSLLSTHPPGGLKPNRLSAWVDGMRLYFVTTDRDVDEPYGCLVVLAFGASTASGDHRCPVASAPAPGSP